MGPKRKSSTALDAGHGHGHGDLSTTPTPEIDALARTLAQADRSYHSGAGSGLTDAEYDELRARLATLAPGHPLLFRVGAQPPEHARKVRLPFWMGSMNKIKDTDADAGTLRAFLRRVERGTTAPSCRRGREEGGPHDGFVVSDKLDGISALYFYDAGQESERLLSRGDGATGHDISHLLPLLAPDSASRNSALLDAASAVRGELVIPRADISRALAAVGGTSARNVVAGQVNAKRPHPGVCKYIRFVPYAVYEPPALNAVEQLRLLESAAVRGGKDDYVGGVVPWFVATNSQVADAEWLRARLDERRARSPFEIDGLILASIPGAACEKREQRRSAPEFAIAFKAGATTEHQGAVVTCVLGVEWNQSKDGLLKPVALLEPVETGGATIRRATAFHAGFVQERKIGVGARVMIVRSGDVIPYIVDVAQPAAAAAMPPEGTYYWKDREIVACGRVADEVARLKRIQHFFTVLKPRGASDRTIELMFAERGLHSVAEFLRYPPFASVGHALARGNVPGGDAGERACTLLMVATNAFGPGMGVKRLEQGVRATPGVVWDALIAAVSAAGGGDSEGQQRRLSKVVREELARVRAGDRALPSWYATYVAALPDFARFVRDNELPVEPLLRTCATQTVHAQRSPRRGAAETGAPLAGVTVVFSGFRDQQLERALLERGAKVTSGVTQSTSYLVVSDDGEAAETEGAKGRKAQRARELGVPIVGAGEFVHALNLQ